MTGRDEPWRPPKAEPEPPKTPPVSKFRRRDEPVNLFDSDGNLIPLHHFSPPLAGRDYVRWKETKRMEGLNIKGPE